MMLTCSALRCCGLEGSAISGASDDAGADDAPAPECIPDAVLYVTVDDETFARVVCNLEHATEFSFDAARDVGARRRRKFDPIEIRWPYALEQGRITPSLRLRGEEPVAVGREDRA